MLTPKENALRMIYGENPEYIPLTLEAFQVVGMPIVPAVSTPLMQSGYDPYGVYWHVDSLGSIPDNSHFMFEEVEDWEKYVKIPDISNIDFKGWAERELPGVDRNEKLLAFYHPTGLWERVAAFMGFENTMISMIDDPENFENLLDVLIDFRIAVAKEVIDAYHPDVYVDFNDVATARGLFFSPELYRTMFKPRMQKLIDYIRSRDVIYNQHCCGKCDDLIDDWVEMGVKMWHSAQNMNDIAGIYEKYGYQLTIEGGWDSSGLPGMIQATDHDVRVETKRCLDEYGHSGGFILLPVLISEEGNSVVTGRDARLPALFEAWEENKAL